MISYLTRPVRFDYMAAHIPTAGGTVLDIGCGNHSPSLTKRYFPGVVYHGLDLLASYNNDAGDLQCMDRFFQVDLNATSLDELPDAFYDCIVCSHVVEHLNDGVGVVRRLAGKLKPGGTIYVETPSPRSLRFPSMRGTLNFWDDATHVRVYTSHELVAALESAGCSILMAATRRSWKRILLFPVHVLYSIRTHGYVSGTVFWDVLGFAHVVIAQRPRS
jgi:trans-aconitate methyltransferase